MRKNSKEEEKPSEEQAPKPEQPSVENQGSPEQNFGGKSQKEEIPDSGFQGD